MYNQLAVIPPCLRVVIIVVVVVVVSMGMQIEPEREEDEGYTHSKRDCCCAPAVGLLRGSQGTLVVASLVTIIHLDGGWGGREVGGGGERGTEGGKGGEGGEGGINNCTCTYTSIQAELHTPFAALQVHLSGYPSSDRLAHM